MLTLDFVKKVIQSDVSASIQYARDMNDTLRLHVDGDRDLLDAKLERINNYENEEEFKARQKHAISNKYLTEELLRPTDNAFNAKGGSRSFLFNTDKQKKEQSLKDLLENVKSGMSLYEYVESVWFHKFITDPNGLIFLELPDKEIEDSKPIPCYKNIHFIKAYQQNGQLVDWVIFEPYEEFTIDSDNKKVKIKKFWAVDKLAYYNFTLIDGKINEPEVTTHEFGEVPAVLCSNIIDNVTGMKISPIWAQVELLDKYLVSNSVLSIAEFSHNYPREWMYVDECNKCNGTGSDIHGEACSTCGGIGKPNKDVTNINELRVPKDGETKIDPPSGYVTLPVDSWQLMVDSVDRYGDIIYFSHWGTIYSKDTKNETATGRFLDAQPVNNRLQKYTKSIEKTVTLLADFYGKYKYPETFVKSEIKYGDRYLIETPDQIWEKYLNSKEKNAPVSQLNLLLYQFIESEFSNNISMLQYELKKMKLEPFVHWDIEIVRASNYISDLDKSRKEYFNEWCFTIDKNKIIETELNALESEFTTYVESKMNKNGETKEEV